MLEKCEIDRPRGATVFTVDEALEVANKLGYPVLVRPSYVLGGAGMEIALNDGDIKKFMKIINRQFQEHPILIDKYLSGKEVEVDALYVMKTAYLFLVLWNTLKELVFTLVTVSQYIHHRRSSLKSRKLSVTTLSA